MHICSIEVVTTVKDNQTSDPAFMINGRAYLDIQSALNAIEDELIEGRANAIQYGDVRPAAGSAKAAGNLGISVL